MPQRVVSLAAQDAAIAQRIHQAFAELRGEMDIPAQFSPAVEAEARQILERVEAQQPEQTWPNHATDTLNIDFVTIDPEGSMDLDQAVHIERDGDGFTVHYAIADVAAFVEAGGAIDAEARVRGTTLYAPDRRTPLHPPALSEGAASLLPDLVRPAAVWTIGLSDSGEITAIEVRRGLIRSRARFSYVEAQRLLDEMAGTGVDAPQDGSSVGLSTIELLGVVGPLRLAVERARGGVSLNVPEQEVHTTEDGGFELEFRVVLPVENYNAQISLLTGISAAQLMLKSGVGVLRTLPPADPRDLKRLRRTATALGLHWAQEQSYGDFLETLDPSQPRDSAFQHEATTLFRGADYLAFSTDPRQPQPLDQEGKPLLGSVDVARSEAGKHNAIGAHYAHVTAPLRRLGDRFTTEICLAASSGAPVPQWVLDALPQLPAWLNAAGRRGNSYERATTDIVEAAVLEHRVGEVFTGTVVELDDRKKNRGDIVIADPAIHAQVNGTVELPLGETVEVTLIQADVQARKVKFAYGNTEGAL